VWLLVARCFSPAPQPVHAWNAREASGQLHALFGTKVSRALYLANARRALDVTSSASPPGGTHKAHQITVGPAGPTIRTGLRDCRECSRGRAAAVRGSAACAACASGRFQRRGGQSTCHACSPGRFTLANANANTYCEDCPAGTVGQWCRVLLPSDVAGRGVRCRGSGPSVVCSAAARTAVTAVQRCCDSGS
jgi:hypothetical protein